MLGCVIVLVAVFGFVNGVRWARSSGVIVGAAVTVDINQIPGPVIRKFLEPALSAEQLREDDQVLATHGLSLYSDPQAVARYRKLAAIYTKYGLFAYTPPPPTQVLFPPNDSVLSGRTPLVASAAKDLHPVRVVFVLDGGNFRRHVLGAKGTGLLWGVRWNTSSLPNGTYQLTCVVDGRSGVTTQSRPILVTVRN
jgi:hypothetical protein